MHLSSVVNNMGLNTTKAQELHKRAMDEEFLANIRYKMEKLYRSAEILEDKKTSMTTKYFNITNDICYSPGEIWIEWESWTGDILRVQGYCVQYAFDGNSKSLKVLCTNTNDVVDVNLHCIKWVDFGEVDE